MVSVKKPTSCRLCLLDSEDLIHIFEMIDGLEYVVADVIEDLLNLKVSRNDTYPHLVCKMCLDKLVDFRNFKNQCYESKFTYDNMLSPDELNRECETRVLFNVAGIVKEESVSDEEAISEDDNRPENLEFKSTLVENNAHSEVSFGPIPLKQEVETFARDSPPQVNYGPIQLKHELASFSRGSPPPPQVHSYNSVTKDGNLDENKFSGMNAAYQFYQSDNEVLGNEKKEAYHGYTLRQNRIVVQSECVFGECELDFDNKLNFSRYYDMHMDENSLDCNICGKHFQRKEKLTRHKKIHGEKKFACDVCNWRFARKDQLVEHKYTHGGEKPFSCSICQKSFPRKYLLRRHQITHDEKRYLCTLCNKMFSRRDHLLLHQRKHQAREMENGLM